MKLTKEDRAKAISHVWNQSVRWVGVQRPYSSEDVVRLQGSRVLRYTHAYHGAARLWQLLQKDEPVRSLGALTGNQALQQVKAGLQSIYLSGWQVAADANNAGQMYPDQSLYPSDSVPEVVRAINNALTRADQIHASEGDDSFDWYAPIVADAEAGFGGVLNAFELMKAMIEAGAAGVHFEDQLSSAKKCGHMGGKVLLPTRESVQKLIAARLASDVCNVPTLLFARTDALAAKLLTSDIDDRDQEFLTGERTVEGFYKTIGGMEQAVSRGLSYSPYADLIWFETGKPDLGEAKEFAEAIHEKFPGKLLSYNCSPSFKWKAHLVDAAIATFQDDLFQLGYRYQFITLAGFHALNHSMFELACKYQSKGMTGYVELQEKEIESEALGYTATAHQREVGAGYFDSVAQVISGGESSVTAMEGSTEEEQF
jgi:isocitrate lyase